VLVDGEGENGLPGGGHFGPVGNFRVEEALLLVGFFRLLDAATDLHRVEDRAGVNLQGILEVLFGQPLIALYAHFADERLFAHLASEEQAGHAHHPDLAGLVHHKESSPCPGMCSPLTESPRVVKSLSLSGKGARQEITSARPAQFSPTPCTATAVSLPPLSRK